MAKPKFWRAFDRSSFAGSIANRVQLVQTRKRLFTIQTEPSATLSGPGIQSGLRLDRSRRGTSAAVGI